MITDDRRLEDGREVRILDIVLGGHEGHAPGDVDVMAQADAPARVEQAAGSDDRPR